MEYIFLNSKMTGLNLIVSVITLRALVNYKRAQM